MKLFTFKRESNDFSDILSDSGIKKNLAMKVRWNQHLMVGMSDNVKDSVISYLLLKFGEEIVEPLPKDFSPVPGTDYAIKKLFMGDKRSPELNKS